MNIQQLRCAIEVGKCGSISKAAERLYMNQPNLSRLIKGLEDEFNITLFSRTPSGVEVTNEGASFLAEAEQIIEKADAFERSFKGGAAARLTFKIAVPRVSYLADAFAAAVAGQKDTGGICVTYRECSNQDIINCVASLGYDMGIIRFPIEFEGRYRRQLAEKQLKAQELFTFRPVAAMSTRHPLAGRAQVGLDELAGYTALIHGDNYSVGFSDKETERFYSMQRCKNSITIFERGSQFDFLRGVPGTFMLVSPLPAQVLEVNGLVQLPLAADETGLFQDMLITRRSRRSTRFEQDFMSSLLDVERDIMTPFAI